MKLKVAVNGTAELRIRQGPSTSFTWKEFLTSGTQVIVIELSSDGSFYKLEDGRGWIGKSYTKIIEDMEKTKPPTPTPTPAPLPEPKKEEPPRDLQRDAFLESLKQPLSSGLATAQLDGTRLNVAGVGKKEDVNVNIASQYSSFSGIVPWDDSFISTQMDIAKRNLNIIGSEPDIKEELYKKFNRFRKAFPELYLNNSFSQVFFTRPDLNILNETGDALHEQVRLDPTFYYLFNQHPSLLHSLTYDRKNLQGHDFNVYLSNSAESFEVPDEYIETQEHGETLTGWKMQYGRHNIRSNTAGNFSISYTDDRDVSLYKMHKLWLNYISMVYRGELKPREEYIKRRILDYVCSVYYFILAPDGETVLFWTKYFGVFPTNVSSSALSWSKGNHVKLPNYNINYAYSWKEDFSPLTLAEFNFNGVHSGGAADIKYLKTYEPGLVTTGRTLVGPPFIETQVDPKTKRYTYKLRFTNK